MAKTLIAIRIDDKVKQRLDEFAAENERTLTSIYVDAIAQYCGLGEFETVDHRAKHLKKPRRTKAELAASSRP